MGVTYVDLQDLRQDSDFYDSTHPLPQVTKNWSERLCSALEKSESDEAGKMRDIHSHEDSLPVSKAE